jgi:protein-S-isoprenylcysteine O-methyltransferase Ste14
MSDVAVWVMFGLGAATFLTVSFVVAPYGRHARAGFGPVLPAKWGWVVMESPAVFGLVAFFFTGPSPLQPGALALVALWLTHYLNRTFIFPFRMRAEGKTMPVLIVAMALGFNVFNAFLNGRWLSAEGRYPVEWLTDPRFLVGGTVFFVGYGLNLWSDARLRSLRKPGETGYQIPRGGLYERISCPNYLGELIEWLGFALAAWSLAGLAFAVYTFANLAPRAVAHHRWYQATFPDYPKARTALIPYLW